MFPHQRERSKRYAAFMWKFPEGPCSTRARSGIAYVDSVPKRGGQATAMADRPCGGRRVLEGICRITEDSNGWNAIGEDLNRERARTFRAEGSKAERLRRVQTGIELKIKPWENVRKTDVFLLF